MTFNDTLSYHKMNFGTLTK